MKNQVQQHVPRKQSVMRRVADNARASKTDAPVQAKHNPTGLPDTLKAGIENLSGHSMDDVKVHYNSAKPSTLQAHAYAQGTDIHVAPGQEKHLPHEAWHVVQQKQGRVKPTRQLKGAVPVNDNAALEKEADTMGAQAYQRKKQPGALLQQPVTSNTVQRVLNAQMAPGSLPLRPEDDARLTEAINLFDQSLATVKTPKQFVYVRIKSMKGTNPASTSIISPRGTDEILVDIAEWFIRISSVGEILGMLAHEVGVHTLANDQMGPGDKAKEGGNKRKKSSVKVGLHTHRLSPMGEKGDKRQEDHVNVVKDSGKGAGSGNPRNTAYVKTILRMGDAIDGSGLSHPEKVERIRDLLQTFLFDYGRILATDDGKAPHKLLTPFKVFGKSYLVSQVMNWYQQVIVRRYAGQHAWLTWPEVQSSAGGWGLRVFLTGKLVMGLFQQGYSTRPGNMIDKGVKMGMKGLGTGAGYVGKGLGKLASPLVNSTAGQYVGGKLSTGAQYAGSALSTGAHYGGKMLGMADTVLGETENMAQNVLSLPFSMASGLWGMGKKMLGKKEHEA